MTTEDIRRGVRAWLKTANGLTDAQVRKADDKGPRATLPYLAIKVTESSLIVGQDEEVTRDDGGGGSEWAIEGTRAATVEIQAYSPTGTTTATEWIRAALRRISRPDVRDVLWGAGLVVEAQGSPTDLSLLLDTQIEHRSVWTGTVRYRVTDTGAGDPEVKSVITDLTLVKYPADPSGLTVTLPSTFGP